MWPEIDESYFIRGLRRAFPVLVLEVARRHVCVDLLQDIVDLCSI